MGEHERGSGATTTVVAAEPTWWQEPFEVPAPPAVERHGADVRIDVLGEVTAFVDGERVNLGGLLPERVLLALALVAPRSATVERLVDAIWQVPPPTATKAVRVHIGRLRRVLGDAAIETSPGGYRLAAAVDVDRLRYLELRHAARAAPAPSEEVRLLTAALACWSGRDATGTSSTAAVEEAQHALDQLLFDDEERHSDLLLAEGLDEHDLATLRDRCDRLPFRERRWEQLVRGLVVAGRRAEAIEAFRRCRTLFADELGLPPGPAVQAAYDRAVAADLGMATFLECRSPLVGREQDLARIDRVLDDHPLVTLVGPPGIGKTQVCLELARRWRRRAEPVIAMEVPPRHRAASVQRDLAGDLGAVRADEDAALDAIVERLAGVSLAVIDGAHRNPGAVADLAEALRATRPRLRLLVTGRDPLGVDGELHLELGPLAEVGAAPWSETGAALYAERRGLAGLPENDARVAASREAPWAEGVPLLIEVAGRLPANARRRRQEARGSDLDALLDGMDPQLVDSLRALVELPVDASVRLLDDLGTSRARQRELVWHGLAHSAGPPMRLRAHDALRDSLPGGASPDATRLRTEVRRDLIERAQIVRPELGTPPDYAGLRELASDLSSLRWLLADPSDDDLELVEHVADLLGLLGLQHEATGVIDAARRSDEPLRRARAALAQLRVAPATVAGADSTSSSDDATEEFRRRGDLAAAALLAALSALQDRASDDRDGRRLLARKAAELAPTPWLAGMAELALGVTELGPGTARAALEQLARAEAALTDIDRRGAALAAFLQGTHGPETAGHRPDPLEHLERARAGAEEVGDRPLAASARLVTLQRLRARGLRPPAGVYGAIADECDRAGLTAFAALTRALADADHA